VPNCGYPRSVRPLVLAIVLLVSGCGNRFNTNAPNDFGKSKEQPPAQKIERTPKQWCLDYCSRARSCAEKDGDEVFKKCKAEHQDCAIEKTENTMCCAEMATCAQFFSCSKEGAPAGC
jgi:hypothetical protein